ncbi:hypothetical protein [Flavobacterium sp. FlaQc-47]|jgi:hypothetical protein|uniref:hypothetical protein n=1 Tax=Flavobacterium sp. FlaQc-47 TaxID=3374180 RepID=UPI003756A2E3
MKKKIYITLATLIALFAFYYYWENRYVELRPVLKKEYTRQIIIFQNDFYRIAERNETPPNFYKNIKYVLGRERQEYTVKNGVIYIKYKYMNDLEMIYNHTLKTNDTSWFKGQREMDSINGIHEKQYEGYQRNK